MFIDLFCCGLKNFNIKILQTLALNNGGTIILHKDFGEEFAADLQMSLYRREILPTVALCVRPNESFCADLGLDGCFSIKTSDCLSVTHVIGPAVKVRLNK